MGKKKDKFRCVKLIANPTAGDPPDPTDRLARVVRSLMDQGFEVDVSLAKPKARATKIARKAAKKGYKLIIALGGDGTIEAAARGLVGTKSYLGILPTGTYNNIAKSLGIPEDLDAACRMLGELPKRRLDVGQATTKEKGKFYFLEMTAIGLTAALYPEAKNLTKSDSRNRLKKLKQTVSTLLNMQAPKMSLKMDGDSFIEVESLLCSVANTPAYGVNFLVAPQASMEDDLLDIMLYPGFSKTDILAYYARVANAKVDNDKRVQSYRAHKVTIKTSPKADIMADGITLGRGKVRIRSLQGALRVIAPRPETPTSLEAPADTKGVPTPIVPEQQVQQPAKAEVPENK